MKTEYSVLGNGRSEVARLREDFASDVLCGMSQPVKTLPCKYIYDERGSRLFSRIMDLPEYYLTRCELEVFDLHKESIGNLIGAGRCNIVELGAGDGKKTKILLRHFLSIASHFQYVPVDISESAVSNLSSELKREFADLKINGLVTDYFDGLRWLSSQNHSRNLVLFLGSNIGNFSPDEADVFLSGLRDSLNDGDLVLIGFDLKKDIELMVRAYNDTQGITEQFNLNILERINNELGGNFDLKKFRYYSTWDAFCEAIKSCLISVCSQTVHIKELNRSFYFRAWEPIHTESSYKFSEDDLSALAEKNGFEIIDSFHDTKRYFVDSIWRVRKDRPH